MTTPKRAASAPRPTPSAQMVSPRAIFEGIEVHPIRTLPGFSKARHFIPDHMSDKATDFVRGLLTQRVENDLQEVYARVKSAFGYRRRDLTSSSCNGLGSLDAPFFAFSIETGQFAFSPSDYEATGRLELREDPAHFLPPLDAVFGTQFDSLVIDAPAQLDFDTLVERFEDLVEAHGGRLDDNQHQRMLSNRHLIKLAGRPRHDGHGRNRVLR